MDAQIDRRFLKRDTVTVARELLGNYLCRSDGADGAGGATRRWMITEVEAYDGPEDKACHAHRGKTPRNAVMFGPAGYYYVYLCYGIHWLLNIVTGPVDYPAAVLIRGVDAIRGPGRTTKALGIDRTFNEQPVAVNTGLWLERSHEHVAADAIQQTPRIGIDYAGPKWANKPYRFVLRN